MMRIDLDEAATWLAAQDDLIPPIVDALRERFGLAAQEAGEVVAHAIERLIHDLA